MIPCAICTMANLDGTSMLMALLTAVSFTNHFTGDKVIKSVDIIFVRALMTIIATDSFIRAIFQKSLLHTITLIFGSLGALVYMLISRHNHRVHPAIDPTVAHAGMHILELIAVVVYVVGKVVHIPWPTNSLAHHKPTNKEEFKTYLKDSMLRALAKFPHAVHLSSRLGIEIPRTSAAYSTNTTVATENTTRPMTNASTCDGDESSPKQ